MARLKLSLLGTLQVFLDEQLVAGFESAKVRALLAYLAGHPERPHNRDALTGLLWPEQAEATARTNLRQALSNLRRTINDQGADPPFLLVSREVVRFNPDADYWLDVALFTTLLDACSRHAHRRPELCTPCAQRLAEAVKLYRGAFLDGLFVQDSVAFEEWMLLQREGLQRRMLQALYQLAAYHERRGAYDEAQRYAWRQIELDPWREEAHCQIMRVLVLRGERTAALVQYETCKRLLQEGLGVGPSEATTALYERIRAAEGDAPMAREQLALPSARPHNLPPQPTPFIGREHELAELTQLIDRPECRLISLVGPGGSGKTRIALQAATEQIEAFSDGVYFVSLAPVQSSEFLVSTIGAALGFSFSGQKEEQTQLLDELRGKEMLLVLDNFEHLLDAADLRPSSFVAVLLQRAPSVTVLATSRERLNLQGEWVVAVEGLPFPDGERSDTNELESYAAIQLFLQSARRIDSSFVLHIQDRLAVARICRLVGGLPLAIELAAAWAPVLSSGEIAHEIAVNLDFLATHLRDVPQRHRSMRAVFDHSWNLLSQEERELFMRLSVFRGGFRREAAEQAAEASLPLLSSLVAKSFLRRNPLGRYEIHELLRQYTAGKLKDNPSLGGLAEAQDRHCSYYADFVQRREGRLRGKDQPAAIEEIGAEIDNVREAWRWGIERAMIEVIEKLTEGLWFYYEIRGLFQEGAEAFMRAASALSGTADVEQLLCRERALTLGKVLSRRGAFVGARMGRVQEGRDLIEQSITLLSRFNELNERRERAFSLNMLGTVARLLCEYEQAWEYFQESLYLFREVGDRWGTAYSLSDLGNVAYLQGEHGEARRLHEESLLISRQAGDSRAMMYCLNDMGSVAIALGEYSAGMRSCQEALAISQEIGHRWGYAAALYQIGTIASYTGEHSEAQVSLQGSLAAFREMGDLQGATFPLHHLGYLAYLRGDFSLARQMLQEVLASCREVGYRRGSATALNSLGRVAQALGEDQTARSYLVEALANALEIQAWPLVLDILVNVAVNRGNEGEREWAREILCLACDHPASEKQTKKRAQGLLARLEEAQPHERVAMSGSITHTKTLEQIVERVIKEGAR